jgi:hypothetical protein
MREYAFSGEGSRISMQVEVKTKFFKPRQLVVPHEVALDFLVTGLVLGSCGRGRWPTGTVPALAFSDSAYPEHIDYDLMTGGGIITLEAATVSGRPRPFRAVLVGEDVEPEESSPVEGLRCGVLGFGSTTVLAGTSCNVNVSPARPFRGERLVVPSTVAGDFQVENIMIGRAEPRYQMSGGPVPGTCFAESVPKFGPHGLALDKCAPEEHMTICIRNLTDVDKSFTAAMFGRYE